MARRHTLVLALLVFALVPPVRGGILFSTNSTWQYFKGRSEASSPDLTAWRLLSFADTNFTSSPAPFWYGDAFPSGTQLTDMMGQYTCIFMRRAFVVTNLVEIGGLRLGARCDDGFITWINGVEVARYNMGAGTNIVFTNTAASSVTEPVPFLNYDLVNGAGQLVLGTNLIAVQVFNQSLTSSDLGIDLSLSSTAPDFIAPVITAITPPPGTVNTLTQITVTFSEPVAGVGAGDLLINGFAATSLAGAGDTYTFSLAQPAYGPVQITWTPLHGMADLAIPANPFEATALGATWQYALVDNTAPTVSVLNPPAGTTARSLTQIEVIFSEPVTDIDAADLQINGSPATSVTPLSSTYYLFQFSPPTTGIVQVAWAADHGIADSAAVPNAFLGGNWSYALDPNAPAADVRINEFLAANQSGLRDEDGEAQDWVELFNRSTNAVNLTGWSLTDDPNDSGQWTFPALALGPRQFLVVFVSGKDRRAVGGTNRLHTNFKLSPLGEYLALFNSESPRQPMSVFNPYPEQRNDYSYGYDAAGQLRYFLTPTPGATNGASAVAGVVEPPHFNVRHGLFNAPFSLHITTPTPGAAIRYTTDGTPPTATNGLAYTGPLLISRMTVMRAAAFKTNSLPSTTTTRSFLFLDDVFAQPNNPPGFPATWGSVNADYEVDPNVVNSPLYNSEFRADLQAIPSLSIVVDNAHMFGPGSLHANPQSTGIAWERPCSAELIYPDGRDGFQVDCGLRIQGGFGRTPSILKHSFRFLFKGDYGPGKLDFPIFEDSPVHEYDTLILRSGMNNSYVLSQGEAVRATFLQDEWMRRTQRALGQAAGYGNFVHLYINGLYWGLYNNTERPNAPFAAAHLGGEKEEYDALNSSEAVDGTKTAWTTLHNLVNAGIANDAQYQAVRQYLDVDNLIDYMLLNFYGGNADWDDHNWYAARRRVPGAGYKFFSWDGERTLEGVTGNDKTGVNQADKPSRLYAVLRTNAEFRVLFGDHVHRHFFNNGAFTPGPAAARFAAMTNAVSRAVVGESARWGDKLREPPYTRNAEWQAEVNRVMSSYFPSRHNNVLAQLIAKNLYPAVAAPVFGQHGGRVPRGFNLTMSAPAGTIYFTTNGVDPRAPLTGAVSTAAVAYTGVPLVINHSMQVQARALVNGTNWSALDDATFQAAELGLPIRITEIMYNPIGGDTYEFVELQNNGGTTIDLGGMSFEGITFVFAPGTLLAPGARLVLSSSVNATAWAARYPGLAAAGAYSGSLANGGERLALKDANGLTIVSVDYNDAGGWPIAPDGGGFSLEIIDPNGDPDDPANWRASSVIHGTPGAANSAPPASSIMLNEIMARNVSAVTNGGAFPDWVELYNSGPNAIDLAGWSLTDDGNPLKFVLPATNLPPGEFLVVWCDTETNAPGLHTGFPLDADGASVLLFDATGTRRDALGFGWQIADTSVGRILGSWRLTVPTPGSANIAATLGSATNLVINEWLANPVPGGDDWLELFNRDPLLPVALRGLYLTTSNALVRINSLSFIAPRGYVSLLADERPGPRHLDFKLPASGTAVTLYDDAAVQVDRISYGAQTSGVSQGRLPDGAGTIVSFPISPSPGASNYLVSYTGPVINEIMARNVASSVVDGLGRRADWIELFNPGPALSVLAGMSLSEGSLEPGEWVFPAGASIPANGYLMIWCDGARPASTNLEPDLNIGHSLSADSGGVYLFNSAGQLVHQVEYGFQIPDRSIGRNGGAWRLLETPTPGATNSGPAPLGPVTGLRINEWMADAPNGDDWFEVFNTNMLPVDLSGLYLSDDPTLSGQTNTIARPLSFIGGRAFVKFQADNDSSKGADHVNFSLDGAGESLRIYDASLVPIDAVDFGSQLPGVSEGRLPDGASYVTSFPLTPTPGASNSLPVPPQIMVPPQSQTISRLSTVTFTVEATGFPAVNFQWRFQGANLAGATNSSLVLMQVQLGQAGEYAVVVANAFGSITSAVATLTVMGGLPPSVVSPPVSLVVTQGGTAAFSVTADGDAPLRYQWRRNGADLEGASHAGYLIPNVLASHAGAYDVVVSNSFGTVTSAVATLTVRTPLAITRQPVSVVVAAGTDTAFSVAAVGDAPLNFQWLFNGGSLAGATGASLLLTNVQPADQGSYSVVVSNALGSIVSAAASLTVVTRPLVSIARTPEGVKLSWTALSGRTYRIYYKDSLEEFSWDSYLDGDVTANGGIAEKVDTTTEESTQRFYRIDQLASP